MRSLMSVLLVGASVTLAGTPSLLVLDFQSKGILDKTVLEQLRERTQEIVSIRSDYAVIANKEARKRIFDQNILVPSRCEQDCYARLAEKLDAEALLVPAVEKNGTQLKISYLLVKRNGSKVGEGAALSDGRVGKVMNDALEQVFGVPMTDERQSIAQQVTVGAATAIGVGAVIFLSSTASPAKREASKPAAIYVDNNGGF